jgi:hypothetical protein
MKADRQKLEYRQNYSFFGHNAYKIVEVFGGVLWQGKINLTQLSKSNKLIRWVYAH